MSHGTCKKTPGVRTNQMACGTAYRLASKFQTSGMLGGCGVKTVTGRFPACYKLAFLQCLCHLKNGLCDDGPGCCKDKPQEPRRCAAIGSIGHGNTGLGSEKLARPPTQVQVSDIEPRDVGAFRRSVLNAWNMLTKQVGEMVAITVVVLDNAREPLPT